MTGLDKVRYTLLAETATVFTDRCVELTETAKADAGGGTLESPMLKLNSIIDEEAF